MSDVFSLVQVKAQTELRKTPVSEAKKTPVTQTQTTCSSQFIPIHHPGAFPPLPSRPGTLAARRTHRGRAEITCILQKKSVINLVSWMIK